VEEFGIIADEEKSVEETHSLNRRRWRILYEGYCYAHHFPDRRLVSDFLGARN